MKNKLIVAVILYTTIITASTTENKSSLKKRIAKAQPDISALSQNIKSGATNIQLRKGSDCNHGCAVPCDGKGK